jgi:hypothetical protein
LVDERLALVEAQVRGERVAAELRLDDGVGGQSADLFAQALVLVDDGLAIHTQVRPRLAIVAVGLERGGLTLGDLQIQVDGAVAREHEERGLRFAAELREAAEQVGLAGAGAQGDVVEGVDDLVVLGESQRAVGVPGRFHRALRAATTATTAAVAPGDRQDRAQEDPRSSTSTHVRSTPRPAGRPFVRVSDAPRSGEIQR